MPSSNLENLSLRRKFSHDLNGEYSQHQVDVSGLDYGSPARSTKVPNLSLRRDTEKEERKNDIDEAMRRRPVANEETDEIVESLKKKVYTSKKKISALEAKIKKLKEFNNRLRKENGAGKLKSEVSKLERKLQHKKAEIWALQEDKSRLEHLLRDEEARTEQETSEAKRLETEEAEQAQNYQVLLGILTNLKEKHKKRHAIKSGFCYNAEQCSDSCQAKQSCKILQSKFTAGIARIHVLREEKHTLKSESEDGK
ncbi:hypothetical protein EAE96_002597 [Botrytis aclada]|nr:hypothetical protein EAE96_002597 [Botrytis aclada]